MTSSGPRVQSGREHPVEQNFCGTSLCPAVVKVCLKAQQFSTVCGSCVFLGLSTFSFSLKLRLLHDVCMLVSTKGKLCHYPFNKKTWNPCPVRKDKRKALLVFLAQNSRLNQSSALRTDASSRRALIKIDTYRPLPSVFLPSALPSSVPDRALAPLQSAKLTFTPHNRKLISK